MFGSQARRAGIFIKSRFQNEKTPFRSGIICIRELHELAELNQRLPAGISRFPLFFQVVKELPRLYHTRRRCNPSFGTISKKFFTIHCIRLTATM
jgi:hypothetical protein